MYHPLCHICQRRLPFSKSLLIINNRSFCKAHYSQYKTRQRDGVNANELNTQWLDTLDNWRDRPGELDHEMGKKPFSTSLFFRQRHEDWLIFMRSYIVRNGQKTMAGVIITSILQSLRPKKSTVILKANKRRKSRSYYQHRMGDALAVNRQTGEIRRFVDVSEDMVLDDLQGIRTAPYQAEIAHLWGNPDPTDIRERFERQYLGENHRILIPALIHLCPFPVYGLIGKPLELSSGYGIGFGGDAWNGIGDVSFRFTSPRYPQARSPFELCSSDPRERHLFYTHEQAIESLLRQYSHEVPGQHDPEERIQFGIPSFWEGEMLIGGTTFSCAIHRWSEPEPITLFRLKGKKAIISGHSFGLAYDDLLQLLKDARPINEREDVLAEYQREADAEQQRLRAQFVQG